MNLSIWLGIVGIVVSIAVGYGAYWLAERRARRNRWEGAKGIVLRDLSMSLGEGNVPEPLVILATIRSVLRGHNAPDLAVVTFEEVRDDLIRQITADPFLDTERRKQLLAQMLSLKAPEVPLKPPEEGPSADLVMMTGSLTALAAGLFASVVAGLGFSGIPALLERVRETLDSTDLKLLFIPLIAGILTLIATVVSVLVRKPKD